MRLRDLLGLSEEKESMLHGQEAVIPREVADKIAEAPVQVEPPTVAEWWWLVLHNGHLAFYLRTLMPGDFAPGRLPAPRHVRLLERGPGLPTEVRCGTCGEVPRSEDLEPIERQTGARGFLGAFRSGQAKWPKQTKDENCWLCSSKAATSQARLRDTDVQVCDGCAKHIERSK